MHIPEVAKIVEDNFQFAKVAQFIINSPTLTENDVPTLAAIVGNDKSAEDIVEAAKTTMGK